MHDREVRPFIFKNVQSFVSNEKYFIIFVSFFSPRRVFLEYVILSNVEYFLVQVAFLGKVSVFSGWNKNVPEQRGTFSDSIGRFHRISKGFPSLEETTNRTTSCLDLSNFL